MRNTFGAFKQLHKGDGIYWAGTYNVEGDGSFQTLSEAKAAIDSKVVRRQQEENAANEAKAASGNYLICRKYEENGVWMSSCETPEGVLTMQMQKFRQILFDLEEKYGKDILWL
jgi:hypothetical protein